MSSPSDSTSTFAPSNSSGNEMDRAHSVLRSVWGYDSFRPLQADAVQDVIQGRDSLVVLPTGGGKSLCYQVPALVRDGMSVVVSPLISLMKDQVDALTRNGFAGARSKSSTWPPNGCSRPRHSTFYAACQFRSSQSTKLTVLAIGDMISAPSTADCEFSKNSSPRRPCMLSPRPHPNKFAMTSPNNCN